MTKGKQKATSNASSSSSSSGGGPSSSKSLAIPAVSPLAELRAKIKETNSYDDLKKLDKSASSLVRELHSNPNKHSELAEVFSELASLHIKMGDSNHDLKTYTDAAIRANLAQKLAPTLKAKTDQQLGKIHASIISNTKLPGTPALHGQDTLKLTQDEISHKSSLEALRTKAKDYISSMDFANQTGANYVEGAKQLFEQLTKGMQGYIKVLYEDAEKVIGLPPCKYSVIGLGSMALGQITPYSDLEFAILTENDDYKNSPDVKVQNYFRNLTHYVHFKVICLGESSLPKDNYDINIDDIAKPAVNFDLGGKTPLGRLDGEGDYDLIATVDKMVENVKNYEGKDSKLLNVIATSCFAHGDKTLSNTYAQKVKEFLTTPDHSGQTPSAKRAVEDLRTETADDVAPVTKKPVKGNLEEYFFEPYGTSGKLFNVKQEIYRLPDRFIYNFGKLYGVTKENPWDTIEQLVCSAIINYTAGQNLQKALSFAVMLRLKTYSHYGYQKDQMDIQTLDNINSEQVSQNIFQVSQDELSESGPLFEFFYTMIPFTEKLKKFCDYSRLLPLTSTPRFVCVEEDMSIEQYDEKTFFKNEVFFSNNKNNKSDIHYRLLRFQEALDHQLAHLGILQKDPNSSCHDIAEALNNLGLINMTNGNYEKALQYFEKALETTQTLDHNNPNSATYLYNKGHACIFLSKYDEGTKYSEEALEIRQKLFIGNHPDIMHSLNNVALSKSAVGDYKGALEYQCKALEMSKNLFKNDHPTIALYLNNVGATYGHLGHPKLALEYQLKALEMRQNLLTSNHPDITHSLNNTGSIYGELGDYEKELQDRLKALEISKKLFKNDHPEVAGFLSNVGRTYGKLNKYKEAENYCRQALEMNKGLFPGDHFHVATSLNNMSDVYRASGDYHKSLSYQLEALKMKERLFTNNPHPSIIISLDNVWVLYEELGDYNKALEYQTKTLNMTKICFGAESSEAKKLCSEISATNKRIHDLETDAISRFQQAQVIEKTKLPPSKNPKITKIQNLKKAALKYEEALKLFAQLSDTQNITITLKKLESVYTQLHQQDKVSFYKAKITEMDKSLHIIQNNETPGHLIPTENDVPNPTELAGEHPD